MIVGPSLVCRNSLSVYTFDSGYAIYNWNVINGLIVSGLGTSSITVQWNTTENEGEVEINAEGGEFPPIFEELPVTINSLPVPVIAGNFSVCEGETEMYATSDNPGSTYFWAVSGGVINGGQNTYEIEVEWTVGGGGSIQVTETNASSCVGQDAVPVIVSLKPTGSISGPEAVAPSSEKTYIFSPAQSSYTWGISGGSLQSGQGTDTISVLWGPEGPGEVEITVTNANNCSNIIFKNITIMPLDNLSQRFVDLFEVPMNTAMEDLLTTIYVGAEINSLQELVSLDTSEIAGEFADLDAGSPYVTDYVDWLKTQASNVDQQCIREELKTEQFFTIQGSGMKEGLEWFVNDVLVNNVPGFTDWKSLITADEGAIRDEYAALGCSTPLKQASSELLLESASGFLGDVTATFSYFAVIQDANGPLGKLEVKVFDEDNDSELIGNDITDSNGLVTFGFAEYKETDGTVASKNLKYEVYDAEGTLVDTVYDLVNPNDGPFNFDVTVNTPPPPADNTPVIANIESEIGATFPAGFITYLDGKGIVSLQDVRRFGGIAHFTDLPVGVEPSLTLLIDQYASLNTVIDAIADCVIVFNLGYQDVLAIAREPRSSFISTVTASSSLTTTRAGFFHAEAVAVEAFTSSVWTATAVTTYNNFKSVPDNTVSPGAVQVKDLILKRCDCEECRTAVSPAAYLATLIDYALKNVKQADGSAITFAYLEEQFLQPWGELTARCEDPNERVCQVRICIDVLNKYIAVNALADPTDQRREFYKQVYNDILIDLGTSLDEIRYIRSFTPEEKRQFAEKLGISEAYVDNTVFSLDVLDNTSDPKVIDRHLEEYFGFPSFYKNPLSQGLVSDGAETQILSWNISSMKWDYNVSENGVLYGKLSFAGGKYTVSLHKNSDLEVEDDIVCTGEINSAEGIINLTPENNSQLFGTVTIAYSDVVEFEIQLIPKIACYRLLQLNAIWKEEDQSLLNNPYYFCEHGSSVNIRTKALIDPDVMSADDIRNPFPDNPSRASATALKEIYKTRMEWLADRKADLWTALFASGDTPNFGVVYEEMMTEIPYTPHESTAIQTQAWTTGTDPNDFADWYKIVQGEIAGDVEAILDEINTNLNLDGPSFSRFYQISGMFPVDITEAKLNLDQRNLLNEFLDIMLLAQKNAINSVWMTEEADNDTYPNQYLFYKSITEPETGIWPPIMDIGIPGIAIPLVDPQVYSLGEYVDEFMLNHEYTGGTISSSVKDLFVSRNALLADDYKNIKAYRESVDQGTGILNGFERLFRSANTGTGTDLLAFEDTIPEAQYSDRLRQLWYEYNGDNITLKNDVIDIVHADLKMSLAEYEQLMPLYEQQKLNPESFNEGDWEVVYDIILKAATRKNHYGNWITAEGAGELVLEYWKVFKQKLNKWRATDKDRTLWLEAIMSSLKTPMLDPDNVAPDYFFDPRTEVTAFDIWETRKGLINGDDGWLEDLTDDDLKVKVNFEAAVEDYFGVTIDELIELFVMNEEEGISIQARLMQLTLHPEALRYFVEYYDMLNSLVTPSEEEEKNVIDILLQVRKIRNNIDDTGDYFAWHAEEYADGIYINPTVFCLPQATFGTAYFNLQEENEWRSDSAHKKQFNQSLGSRIQRIATTLNNVKESVDIAEEINLVYLRDALVMVVQPSLPELGLKADWFTDNLLIDAKVQCCQPTTRIAQAIETMHSLLFGLRTETLDIDPAPVISNDSFDSDWRWLSSYGSWRSLMFMYLYPENLLDPTFRSVQTDVFRQITGAIRDDSRLNPGKTDSAMKEYFRYYKDIATLEIKAACSAKYTNTKDYNFMFGMGTETGTVYWSAYTAMANYAGEQKIWNPVPGLTKVNKVLGCVPYKVKSGARYIYLFVYSSADKEGVIKCNRFNLDTSNWDAEPLEFEVDKNLNASSGIVEQTMEETQAPHLGFVDFAETEVKTRQINFKQINEEGNSFSSDIWPVWLWVANLESIIRLKDNTLFVIARLALHSNTFSIFRIDFKHKVDGRLQTIPDPQIELKYAQEAIGTVYDSSADRIRFYFSRNTTTYCQAYNSLNCQPDGISTVFGYSISFIGPQLPSYHSMVFNGTGYKSGIWGGKLHPVTRNFLQCYRLSPKISAPFELKRKLTQGELQNIRLQAEQQYKVNQDYSESLRIYIEEAYYFMPMFLGLNLQRSQYFIEALDWFRTAFDYSVDSPRRKIYYGLKAEEDLNHVYNNSGEWLKDPRDPHKVAAGRQFSYTRYTVLSIVQCMLDYADAEFTRDTSESVPRARNMYLAAIDLLNEEVYGTLQISCASMLNDLDTKISDLSWWTNWEKLKILALKVSNLEQFTNMVNNQIKPVLEDELLTWPEKYEAILAIIEEQLKNNTAFPNYAKLIEAERKSFFAAQLATNASADAANNVNTLRNEAVNDFAIGVSLAEGVSYDEVITGEGNFPFLSDLFTFPESPENGSLVTVGYVDYDGVQEKTWHEAKITGFVANTQIIGNYMPYLNTSFCVPTNPMADYQLGHAEINLYKIRNCMNISGLKRELDPFAAPTDAYSGLPLLGTSNLSSASGGIPRSSSVYRYQFLLERAKQTVSTAQQLEATLLASLEKRDAEAYGLMKARQDISMARANIQLQDLRVNEANHGLDLAEIQKERATKQVTGLQTLIDNDAKIDDEMIRLYEQMLTLQDDMAQNQFNYSAAKTAVTSAAAIVAMLPTNASAATGLGIAAAAEITAANEAMKSQKKLNGLQTNIQKESVYISQERRKNDWFFQQELARIDERIGDQQIVLANDRVKIVEKEKAIAELQYSQADDTLNFLLNKFTNKELYEWMIGVLQKAYNYFLQQATAQAKLAQLQLAFERQEGVTSMIQDDYYSLSSGSFSGNDTAPDRRGLTGSARLLVDIAKLENYALDTDKRKHQITKAISLRTLFPVEFSVFKTSGVLNFNTSMEMFDRDYPGHYLRLIKGIRVTVLALIPPLDGIKATLYNSGISRVAVKTGSVVQTVNTTKTAESVALSSPFNASGINELEPQNPAFYLPFEGTGVATSWIFEMLKGSNEFDYRTISDILISIDYSSLSDSIYRSRVFRQLNANSNADSTKLFSIKHEFADAWYAFNNPTHGQTHSNIEVYPMDFPSQIKMNGAKNVKLYFSFKDNKLKDLKGISLAYCEKDSGEDKEEFDNVFENRDLILSSGSTKTFVEPPTGIKSDYLYGKWRITLANQVTNKIKSGEIEDILFVIEYNAEKEKFPTI